MPQMDDCYNSSIIFPSSQRKGKGLNHFKVLSYGMNSEVSLCPSLPKRISI